MASSEQIFLFSLIFLVISSVSEKPSLPTAIIFPVTKDLETLQYVTELQKGTPLVPFQLVLDLNGPFLWLDCTSDHQSLSSSHHTLYCNSLHCSLAKATTCDSCKTSCGLKAENTISRLTTRAELAEDIIPFGSKLGLIPIVRQVLFSCAPRPLLEGLANGAKGMLGLGRSRISLPTQLSNQIGLPRKFAVCLASSNGAIFLGGGPYLLNSGIDISKSLMYTPLISKEGDESNEYYVNVKSLKINGKRLSANFGVTKISTTVAYSTMEIKIYKTFIEAFVKAATLMNVSWVEPVAPFEICFSSKGAQNRVPIIDLVLQSEMVKWRIHGRNSMVKINDEVMCLGFLDGGSSPSNSFVIGGYQLEDNLLEFNLGTSMLGFSSSFLLKQASCSELRFNS